MLHLTEGDYILQKYKFKTQTFLSSAYGKRLTGKK